MREQEYLKERLKKIRYEISLGEARVRRLARSYKGADFIVAKKHWFNLIDRGNLGLKKSQEDSLID